MKMHTKRSPRKKSPEPSSRIRLTINGQLYELTAGRPPAEVDPAHTLAHTLRETLGLTGTKIACDHGACGSCTVLVEDRAMLSCMLLTIECDGKSITTIEGLADPKTGTLDPLQHSCVAFLQGDTEGRKADISCIS